MKICTDDIILDMDILMNNINNRNLRDLKMYREIVEDEIKKLNELNIYLSRINTEIINKQEEEIGKLKNLL